MTARRLERRALPLLLDTPRAARTVRAGALVRVLYLPYLAVVVAQIFLGDDPLFRWGVQVPVLVVFVVVVARYGVLRWGDLRTFRRPAA